MMTIKRTNAEKKRLGRTIAITIMLLGLSSVSFADSYNPYYPYNPYLYSPNLPAIANPPPATLEQSLSAGVAAAVNSALGVPPSPSTGYPDVGNAPGKGWKCPPGQAKKGNCFCPPGQHKKGNC